MTKTLRLISFWTVLLGLLSGSHTVMADNFTQLGWPASLAKIYYQLDAKPKNYFILISRLPTIPIDFRSNEGLRNSINSFSFQKNFHPGHEIIGWKCRIGDTPYESVLGFSGESDDQHNDLLNAGWGLSSLLATFKDGFIQTPSELENRFQFFNEENAKSIAAGKGVKIFLMATVFEITEQDCEKVVNEVYEYTGHYKNPTENFSMILSPTEYEGAGCGSFATHFMERVESLKAFPALFRRQFNLPDYLFGTGAYLPNGVEIPEFISRVAQKKPVSKLKLIASSWTSSVSPNVNVQLTDPELIIFWQKLFFQTYYERHQLKSEKKSFDKLLLRGFWEREEDIYRSNLTQSRFVTIDKNFDAHTQEIISHQAQILQGTELTLFTFSNFPGIILEKN